ncbi:hypothetical protein ACI3KW_07615 [Devosia sp. ZW T5_3]|uniref:hypothetical protein n=1 Tax=Devosia sp. ZW T5_3 TaxID=3378085 RepID=UPI0038520005
MNKPSEPQATRPETDSTITEFGRGKAERVVLGSKPYGSMVRIVLAVLVFVLVFGTIFFLAQG